MKRLLIFTPLWLLVVLWTTASVVCSADESMLELQQTVHRYFAGNDDYDPGDLITRTQIGELHNYLKRTRRRLTSGQRQLKRRFLLDGAFLSRLYYRESNGEVVLREAARRIGGYAELDDLTHQEEGRALLKSAIQANRPGDLAAEIEKRRKAAMNRGHEPDRKVNHDDRERIYTVEEYLLAMEPAPSAGGNGAKVSTASHAQNSEKSSQLPDSGP